MEITKTNEENRVTDALIEARECLVEIQGYLVGANCPYTRQRIDKTLDMIREALK